MNDLIRPLLGLFLLVSPLSHGQMALRGGACPRLFSETQEISADRRLLLKNVDRKDVPQIMSFIRGLRKKMGVDPDLTADQRPLFEDFKDIGKNYDGIHGQFFVIKNGKSQI